uniref:KRAB domain-containing protein n=1 Tax=Podarcis muralis TaxID=64176 RepID=A0A670HR31_PODMU
MYGGVVLSSRAGDLKCLYKVSFEDVAVCFSNEEWAVLDSHQKVLHREVMEEIVVSLGKGLCLFLYSILFCELP